MYDADLAHVVFEFGIRGGVEGFVGGGPAAVVEGVDVGGGVYYGAVCQDAVFLAEEGVSVLIVSLTRLSWKRGLTWRREPLARRLLRALQWGFHARGL